MRTLLAAILLGLLLPLAGCHGELTRPQVAEFIDKADDAARKRYAPEICKLRAKDFGMKLHFQGYNPRLEATEMEIGRKLYCQNAAGFSRIRQYRLERTSMDIDIGTDRKTARVTADYVETSPYYEPGTMPATPDDFQQFQVVTSRDESVVGIEDGGVKFLSTDSHSVQKLIPKSSVSIPYE